jgi:hypothetical protein
MVDFFDRIKGPPQAEAVLAENEATRQKHQLIERLLDWLMENWTGDSITARQIRLYGPYPFRPPAPPTLAVELAQELAARGWLRPIKTQRRDSWEWKIGRPAPRAQAEAENCLVKPN